MYFLIKKILAAVVSGFYSYYYSLLTSSVFNNVTLDYKNE